MYHTDHIRAYWLHCAMQFPGGAALGQHRIAYWVCIANMNHYRLLSGGLV